MRHPRFESADDEEIIVYPLLQIVAARFNHWTHHQRRPEFGGVGYFSTYEAFASDADHSESNVIQGDRAADDAGIAAKTFLPTTVTENDNWMGFRSLIFVRKKATTAEKRDAENIKVISGSGHAPDALVVSVVAEACDHKPVGYQPGENLVAVSVVLIIQIGLERVIGAVMKRAVKFLE